MIDTTPADFLRFPSTVHKRKHGPAGYYDYRSYKDFLRDEFTFRCGYCLTRELWYPNGHAAFGVDHYLPREAYPQQNGDYENLIYACNRCNAFKGEETGVLNPCAVALGEHLRFNDNGVAESLTDEGEVHILILDLNGPEAIRYRRMLRSLLRQIQANPTSSSSQSLLRGYWGFPADLPDVKSKRPPKGNARKEGVIDCYFEQNKRGTLPLIY